MTVGIVVFLRLAINTSNAVAKSVFKFDRQIYPVFPCASIFGKMGGKSGNDVRFLGGWGWGVGGSRGTIGANEF